MDFVKDTCIFLNSGWRRVGVTVEECVDSWAQCAYWRQEGPSEAQCSLEAGVL